MAETLYIRLGSQAQEVISWLIFSSTEQEIIASGELNNAKQLTALTDKAQQRAVTVFVPGCDVSLKRLTVPTKSQRAMRAAVPYMLEDELAQDVEQLFFSYAAIANDQDRHNCFVAITERAQMQQWKTWLADANIHANIMQPDILAMPYTDGQWSAVTLATNQSETNQSQILVRQGEWQGVVLDAETWVFWLTHALSTPQGNTAEDAQHKIILNAYSALPNMNAISNQTAITLVIAQPELPLALLAQHSHKNDFNLLKGEFKITEQRSKNLTNWLWVVGFVFCALLLNVGYKSAKLWQLSAQQTQVETQIIARYKQTFPNAKNVRIGTIKSQLERKITELGGTNEQAGFLAMLSKVQPAFTKVPELKPESFKFDGKKQLLRLQASATDYQYFERFKRALNAANLSVEQGAQKNQGEQVTGSFSITDGHNSQQKRGQ